MAKIPTQVTKCFQSQKSLLQKQTDHTMAEGSHNSYKNSYTDSSVQMIS